MNAIKMKKATDTKIVEFINSLAFKISTFIEAGPHAKIAKIRAVPPRTKTIGRPNERSSNIRPNIKIVMIPTSITFNPF
jgi:hypothetical protein